MGLSELEWVPVRLSDLGVYQWDCQNWSGYQCDCWHWGEGVPV